MRIRLIAPIRHPFCDLGINDKQIYFTQSQPRAQAIYLFFWSSFQVGPSLGQPQIQQKTQPRAQVNYLTNLAKIPIMILLLLFKAQASIIENDVQFGLDQTQSSHIGQAIQHKYQPRGQAIYFCFSLATLKLPISPRAYAIYLCFGLAFRPGLAQVSHTIYLA